MKITACRSKRLAMFGSMPWGACCQPPKGLTVSVARALANAGFHTVEDLRSTQTHELAIVPRIGAKGLAILGSLTGVKKAGPRGLRPRRQ